MTFCGSVKGVHGLRGEDGMVGVANIREASIWTTVVVPSECGDELHAFNCCAGSPIYGSAGAFPTATKSDTNLRLANQIPFDAFVGRQFEWHVPAVAPARFQPRYPGDQPVDYDVRPSDVGSFAASALIRFYVDDLIVVDCKPSLDTIQKVTMDDVLQYHQIVQRLPEGQEVQMREGQCIRASIQFPSGGPKFGNGASIAVILAWRGTSVTRV